ncbi:MAG TPA: histidine kinase N-terminal 7TM domain-containing protein [Bacilli bacterium]
MGEIELDFGIFLFLLFVMICFIAASSMNPLHKVYLWFHVCMMLWPLSQFTLALMDNPFVQSIYVKLAFAGLSLTGYGWLLFSLFFTKRLNSMKKQHIAVLGIPAVVAGVVAVANPGEWFMKPVDGFYQIRDYGPLFWVFVAVALGYAVASASLLTTSLRRPEGKAIQKQAALFLSGLLLLVIFAIADVVLNVLYAGDRLVVPGMLSIGIMLSVLCFMLAIMRYNAFGVVSIARENVVRHMPAGVIVLDRHDLVIDLNDSAKRFGYAQKDRFFDLPGYLKDADDLHPSYVERFTTEKTRLLQFEVKLRNDGMRHVAFRITPIYNSRNDWIGRIILMNDVTKLRTLLEKTHKQNITLHLRNDELLKMQKELIEANEKLKRLAVTDELPGT